MAQTIELTRSAETLRSAGRFLAVGIVGTLVDFSLFAGLSLRIGLPPWQANTFSYSAGILNNYILHRRWTFAHRLQKDAGRQFAQFLGVSLSALALNNLMVLLLTEPLSALLGGSAPGAVGAKLCAIGLGVVWNFLANSLWTFRSGTVD